MSLVLVATAFLVLQRTAASAGLDLDLEEGWKRWKSTHGKEYLEGEQNFRRTIWEKNLEMIQQHNLEASLGKHTYWLGMNHFGDLTNEEYNQRMNGFHQGPAEPPGGNMTLFQKSATLKTPKEVDWRKKGYVTRVKDQGNCGSCWAFSATGALEGLHFKVTKQLVSLSEQNLIDCSEKFRNRGCRGGNASRAFLYVQHNGGINSEQTYPYLSQNSASCRYNPQKPAARCTSFVVVPKGDEKALEQAVANAGPVSIALDSRSKEFQFYKSGIFSSPWSGHELNHAMLVVGYVSSPKGGKGRGYWILKNSWSKMWGEKGYMRLLKGANHCGIADGASYPVLAPV
ncbi:procathepsin L-like [Eublepharis macularius]|uniref:Procathepsin L-like n=1 Tax=Eublepharis macularius TaxID=481883 RepID=A0AA97KZ07_EUBMA|nr:procathepsin L-like [Eublepharis macularius]